MVAQCAIMDAMKTTKDNKDNHVGLRLDDDSLAILDGLCEAVGGASRSRVLRLLLSWMEPRPDDRYTNDDGTPVEGNSQRRKFVNHVRKIDDAIIADMVASIESDVRRR